MTYREEICGAGELGAMLSIKNTMLMKKTINNTIIKRRIEGHYSVKVDMAVVKLPVKLPTIAWVIYQTAQIFVSSTRERIKTLILQPSPFLVL